MPDAVPPGASGEVSDITEAYEELLKKVEELEAQLQKTAKAHTANRNAAQTAGASAEQSADGMVGAFGRVMGAAKGIKVLFAKTMGWLAVINQASEFLGKVWDIAIGKTKQVEEAATKQAEMDKAALERLKELKKAVIDEADARRKAARDAEQTRINKTYEERLTLVERTAELEAIAAASRAREANDQYAMKQAELQRDLATNAITRAQYDERMRQAEIDRNDEIRRLQEEKDKSAVTKAQEQERINKESHEKKKKRLEELKNAVDDIMSPADFELAMEKNKKLLEEQARLNAKIEEEEKRTGRRSHDNGKYEEITNELYWSNKSLNKHKGALTSLGLADKDDDSPNKWGIGTKGYQEEIGMLSDEAGKDGSVIDAHNKLTAATHNLTKAQALYQETLAASATAKDKETKETDALRAGRIAEQDRANSKNKRESEVKGAQQTVDQLQRTAAQQQQAAKTQQEAIDQLLKGSADKDFKTLLDRMQAVVDLQSNEGGYRDRRQQATDMVKGYITATPEQLSGKMDEMTEALKRATPILSEVGTADMQEYSRLVELLISKAAMGGRMNTNTQQQQTASNNLTDVRDATSAVDAADAGVQGMTNAVSAMATMALSLRDKSTSPEAKADLETIAEIMKDGIVAANETDRMGSSLQSLALADQQAYGAITGNMQEMIDLISAQLPTLQAIPPWAGKVGSNIKQLRDTCSNWQGAMSAGFSTLP